MERDVDARKNVILMALNAANQLYLSALLNDLDESSDNESEITGAFLTEEYVRLRGPNKKPPRIENFFEDVVPRYNTRQFRENYRMLSSTFEQLEQRLGPILQGDGGKPCVPVRTQLLASIWLLATPDCHRSVGIKHDLSKSSLSASVRRVVNALVNIAGEVIKWPTGQRLADVKHKFEQRSNLPNVIGAIDGCDVSIRAPNENSLHYKTRKKTYAVVLQTVCDSDLVLTDCFAGYPGSVGDCRIFRNSHLYLEGEQNIKSLFPNNEYITGDKAYPVTPWRIAPYKDNGRLTRAQKRFNVILCKTRQVIERAFALLKGRFRRLKYLDMQKVELISDFILACCVLHNICLIGLNEEVEEEDVEDFIQEGLQIQEERDDEDDENVVLGDVRRAYLTAVPADD